MPLQLLYETPSTRYRPDRDKHGMVLQYLKANEAHNVMRYESCTYQSRCETRLCELCQSVRAADQLMRCLAVSACFKKWKPRGRMLGATLMVADVPVDQLRYAITTLYSATCTVLKCLKSYASYQQTEIVPKPAVLVGRGSDGPLMHQIEDVAEFASTETLPAHPHVHVVIWSGQQRVPVKHELQRMWDAALVDTRLTSRPIYLESMGSEDYLEYVTKAPAWSKLTADPQWFAVYADAIKGQKLRRLRVSADLRRFQGRIKDICQLLPAA